MSTIPGAGVYSGHIAAPTDVFTTIRPSIWERDDRKVIMLDRESIEAFLRQCGIEPQKSDMFGANGNPNVMSLLSIQFEYIYRLREELKKKDEQIKDLNTANDVINKEMSTIRLTFDEITRRIQTQVNEKVSTMVTIFKSLQNQPAPVALTTSQSSSQASAAPQPAPEIFTEFMNNIQEKVDAIDNTLAEFKQSAGQDIKLINDNQMVNDENNRSIINYVAEIKEITAAASKAVQDVIQDQKALEVDLAAVNAQMQEFSAKLSAISTNIENEGNVTNESIIKLHTLISNTVERITSIESFVSGSVKAGISMDELSIINARLMHLEKKSVAKESPDLSISTLNASSLRRVAPIVVPSTQKTPIQQHAEDS